GLNTLGTMYVGLSSSSVTTDASAYAAASSMLLVILCDCASSSPRNTPGNASTLLIWLAKSERPVPTTAAYWAASSGSTSGRGFASANTIASFAIVETSCPVMTSGAETPMNTSASRSASGMLPEMPRGLVIDAVQNSDSSRPGRSARTTPSM